VLKVLTGLVYRIKDSTSSCLSVSWWNRIRFSKFYMVQLPFVSEALGSGIGFTCVIGNHVHDQRSS